MYNKTQIIGYLGNDPEMRYTPSGTPVASFDVATNKTWTDANGERATRTTWFRVTCWNKLAEIVSTNLSKGRSVFVAGEVSTRAYLDRNNEARSTLELRADEVRFLDRRGNDAGNSSPGPSQADLDEDVPF